MAQIKEIVWKMYPGREFAEDIEFNDLVVDGEDFDLTGRVVILAIGDTEYRSGTNAELAVPTPTNGVVEFRLSDADTAAFTGHQYELKVDVENDTGFTTPYIRGIVSMES